VIFIIYNTIKTIKMGRNKQRGKSLQPYGQPYKEHDATKSMLETIRGGSSIRAGIILEGDNQTLELNNVEYDSAKNQFSENVGGSEFTSFKIYPDNQNAIFSGYFRNGIEWQYSLVDGCYINVPNMKLDDDAVTTITKLNANYVTWRKEWDDKVRKEYSVKNNEPSQQ